MIKNLMIEVFDSDWIYHEVFLEEYSPKPRGNALWLLDELRIHTIVGFFDIDTILRLCCINYS